MARAYALKIDVADLVRRSGRLDRFTGEEIGAVTVVALNEVVETVFEQARERMNAGINISDDQLRRAMSIERATAQKPVASLIARGDVTGLSHYKPEQRVQPALRPKRSKGDPRRGIPRGSKSAGVSVEVTRGGRKNIQSDRVFITPGIRDTQGNPLVFQRISGTTRSGKTKIRRLLGPSTYQLFRYQIEHGLLDEAADQLQEKLSEQLQTALQEVLE